jgi:hypothetical protein
MVTTEAPTTPGTGREYGGDDDGCHREAPPQLSGQDVDASEKPLARARALHDVAHQDEKRYREKDVIFHHGEEIQRHGAYKRIAEHRDSEHESDAAQQKSELIS